MRTQKHRLTVFTMPSGESVTTRSALEARWAVFFTELRLEWNYEPPSVAIYTPDFFVEGLGYVEIKPTLDLLISESSKKIQTTAHRHPGEKFFAFVGNKVTFETCALYLGDTIFAPTWKQMVKLFDAITDSKDPNHIAVAMQRANGAKLDHFVSVGKVLELEDAEIGPVIP